MSTKLHILEASGRLEPFKQVLETAATQTIENVKEYLPIPDVDIVILDSPNTAIEEIGVGGFAPLPHVLYISIDPQHTNLINTLAFDVKSALTHELHHCTRWSAYKKKETLGDALIAEGLADSFDYQINQGELKPWNTAIPQNHLQKYLTLAMQELDSVKYDHEKWFFGTDELPRWTGYSLGFWIVKKYLTSVNKTADELVDEPTGHFFSALS